MFEKTEPQLISSLKTGSTKAFDSLYRLYARRLYAFCLKYTRSRETAEETVEDTFVWLWNNRGNISDTQSLKPLLFLKTRHLLINAYRRVVNSPVFEEYVDYLDHQASTSAPADENLEYDDFVRQLNLALQTLPPVQREIVRLSKIEMLNNKEIAHLLDYEEQTVKNQLSMGIKKLRSLLAHTKAMVWLPFFFLN